MENLIDILSEIVEALKNIAPEIYKIFYKQALSEGVIQLVVCVILIVASVLLLKLYIKIKDNTEAPELLFIPIVLFPIVSILLFVNGILQVINPDYYAIQLLIEQIK